MDLQHNERAALAACFVAGMLAADGVNGAWIAAPIGRTARIAARIFGTAIATLCLVVAAIGVGKVAMPDVDGWPDGRELALGVAVIAIVALCYAVAVRWPRARVERAGNGWPAAHPPSGCQRSRVHTVEEEGWP